MFAKVQGTSKEESVLHRYGATRGQSSCHSSARDLSTNRGTAGDSTPGPSWPHRVTYAHGHAQLNQGEMGWAAWNVLARACMDNAFAQLTAERTCGNWSELEDASEQEKYSQEMSRSRHRKKVTNFDTPLQRIARKAKGRRAATMLQILRHFLVLNVAVPPKQLTSLLSLWTQVYPVEPVPHLS